MFTHVATVEASVCVGNHQKEEISHPEKQDMSNKSAASSPFRVES